MTPLVFNGRRLIEIKPDASLPDDRLLGVCGQCAALNQDFCCIDLFDAAESWFGGDCEARNVVYAEQTA